ncbi:MAG TPA: phosphotransferase family protein [Acidimicrobiales bacterium]|nr:phosphotransferase family protein [Acidimicrobiales bacterium]
MSNGYSCEIEIVGDVVRRRPPAGPAIFPSYDLELEARVINAVRVPAPRPARYADGVLTMPFVAGPIPADFTPLDPWLQGLPDDAARRRVWESTIDTIAAIHREPLVDGLRVGLTAELDYWADYLDWMGDVPDDLRRAYDWCCTHAPLANEPAPVLLWGDVRFGNIVYDEATLRPKAVLDWEMVSAGPAAMDVAWLTALDQVGRDLSGLSVPGFGGRDEALARFGFDSDDVDWYEVFALVRASAIATRIGLLKGKTREQPTLTAALQRIG